MSTTRPENRLARLIAAAAAALVFAAAGPAHAEHQPASGAPRFTTVPCARLTSGYAITFEERAGKRVTCGYVTVLENRAKPAGPTIDLPVVWFHAPDKSATDAVIYLSGGPGGAALSGWPIIDVPGIDAWLDGRDFILFDQRGTGMARPSLACRDLSAAMRESFTRVGDARSAVVDDAMRECRDQLRDKGIDLAAYTTPASADDVEDIRTALGIDKLNLWGVSYGTRLALEVMRRHPESVRSAVLDSVVPAQANPFLQDGVHIDRMLDRFFRLCGSDPKCNRVFPRLETVFYDTIAALDANPAEVKLVTPRGALTAKVLGSDLYTALRIGMYDPTMFPKLPVLIHNTGKGDYRLLALLLTRHLATLDHAARGMSMSVSCADFASHTTVEEERAAMAATSPRLAAAVERAGYKPGASIEQCRQWGAAQLDAASDDPVVSAIPALVLNNLYDPATPPEWAEQAAETLSNATLVISPQTGHGTMRADDRCVIDLIGRFLAEPEAKQDVSCVAQFKPVPFELPR